MGTMTAATFVDLARSTAVVGGSWLIWLGLSTSATLEPKPRWGWISEMVEPGGGL